MARVVNTEIWLGMISDEHKIKHMYDRAVYVSSHDLIEIGCVKHGTYFWQTAGSHKSGCGCPICARERSGGTQRTTQADFVARSLLVKGGEDTNHSMVVYKNSSTKVHLICNKDGHGSFHTSPRNRLKGQGCPKCAQDSRTAKQTKTQDVFISQCLLHPSADKFDFSDTVYIGDKYKVSVRCKEHGVWTPVASNLLQGQGCPACARNGYHHKLPGYLYILSDGDITKVGITNRKPILRVKEVIRSGGPKLDIIAAHYFQDGSIPRSLELACHKYLAALYKSVDAIFDGSTECFLQVDVPALLTFITPLAATNPEIV